MKGYYHQLSAYVLETLVLFSKDARWFNHKMNYVLPEKMKLQLESKSVIVMGSHQGHWEWAAVLFPLFTGINAHAVYKPLSNKALDVLVKKSRSRFGLGLLSMKEVVRYMATHQQAAVYFLWQTRVPEMPILADGFHFWDKKHFFSMELNNLPKIPAASVGADHSPQRRLCL